MNITIQMIEAKAKELTKTTNDFATAKVQLIAFSKQDHQWMQDWSTQAYACHQTINRSLIQAGFQDDRNAGTASAVSSIIFGKE